MKKRQHSIDLVRKSEEMKIYTKEPICITKVHADKLILDLRWIL